MTKEYIEALSAVDLDDNIDKIVAREETDWNPKNGNSKSDGLDTSQKMALSSIVLR